MILRKVFYEIQERLWYLLTMKFIRSFGSLKMYLTSEHSLLLQYYD